MHQFDVQGFVQQIHPGPVVTTFEFRPEARLHSDRMNALADDLRLALNTESLRIVRIPETATVGIEVTNDDRAPVVLRELIESPEYSRSPARLPLALGKDVSGKIIVYDLSRMPHLLIVGANRADLSAAVNAMILSLLFRSGPDALKMILVDPNPIALGLYQDIPHLLVPVISEPLIALHVLQWGVTEMEERYKKLAKLGVRNVEAYNDPAKQLSIDGPVLVHAPLPYIVIVIADLADLMKTDARKAVASITPLAQMGRAVGIHLVLAAQRPSVDVVAGMIKANFPARISLRVPCKVDSRAIIDRNGAEQLLEHGDMLFLPPGASELMRVHGPRVTEDDVIHVVDFLKQ
jgi:S-DNA-T family DNA segregation ATPase FtsK/SpoIIIE